MIVLAQIDAQNSLQSMLEGSYKSGTVVARQFEVSSSVFLMYNVCSLVTIVFYIWLYLNIDFLFVSTEGLLKIGLRNAFSHVRSNIEEYNKLLNEIT